MEVGRGGACVPARTSAQRRFHTNQYTHCVRGMNDGCALVGRHGRAHRHRPYSSPSYFSTQSTQTKFRPCAIHPKRNQPSMCIPPLPISTKPRGVPLPHHIVHSIAPNHAVRHYPIGVILSIAQGWQVQRCLPWVMMQARRLPPWGLYSFSSHIITTRGK